MTMLPVLQAGFDALERRRHDLLERLRGSSPEQLAFHPPGGGWSLLEVAEHMVIVEEAVGQQIQKNEVLAERRTPSEWVRLRLMRFWLGVGLRARAPRRVRPEGHASLDEIEQRWAALRQQLRGNLETVTAEDLDRLIARHPVAGNVTLADSVSFLEQHFDHHLRQMKRVREAAGFPK